MTVSTTTNKAIHTGDGILTQFAYTYRLDADTDMRVYLDDVIQPSGYTITRNPDDIGGVVDFDVAPGSGIVVTLLRYIEFTQETDYVPYDPFPAESHEDALDKLTMITQQIQEQVDRNTQNIGGSPDTDTSAPPYEANKGWKWSDGNPDKKIINTIYDPDQQVILAEGFANSASASASSASASASSANQSENFARQWATNGEFIPINDGVNPQGYSAYHWAKRAESNVTGVVSINGEQGVVTGYAKLTDAQTISEENAIVFAIALG